MSTNGGAITHGGQLAGIGAFAAVASWRCFIVRPMACAMATLFDASSARPEDWSSGPKTCVGELSCIQ